MERHYDAEAVEALSKKEIEYTDKNGEKHELTRYEAEQTQRKIERTIRRYKKRVAVAEGAGLDAGNAKTRLGEWQAVARDFCKQTGLRRDYAREYVGVERTLWNPTQSQPRGSKVDVSGDISINETNISKYGKDVDKIDFESTRIAKAMNFSKADNGKPNPNFEKEGGDINCQTCVAAFYARTLGYNVQARTRVNNVYMNALAHNTALAYTDIRTGEPPKYILPNVSTKQECFDWLHNNLQEGKLYSFQFDWRKGGFGHIVNIWKNNNGNIVLYDPQKKGRYIQKNLSIQDVYLDTINIHSIKLLNLSDCILDKDFVSKIFEVEK